MKLKLLFLLILLTSISKAQEVFTSDFQGNIPASLTTIEGELYVSIFGANSEREAGIYKLPFNDPSNINTVYESPIETGAGPLYITYNQENNSLFATQPGIGLVKVDLNQALPVVGEPIVELSTLSIANNNGLIPHEGFIYFSVSNEAIYRIAASGESDPELFFTVPEADNFVITQIINNELYYFKYNDSIDLDLLKVSISDPSSETLVSTVDNFGSFVQSSYFANNTLFVGLESNTSSASIFKYDLTQSVPITGEPIMETLSVGAVLGITSYEDDLYFTDGNSQNIFRLEDGILNVSEFENLELSIFPNPTSDRLFIEGQNTNQVHYQLIDILGRIISQDVYTSEGIDFKRLETGIYFVKINDTNGNTLTRKVVKN